MSRVRFRALFALAMCTALSLGGFVLLRGAMRRLEISAVLAVLHFDAGRLSAAPGYTIQALPQAAMPFRAHVTAYCSSLVAVLALAGIAAFVLSGPWPRRVFAFLGAAAVIFVCNVIRIAASVWVGLRFGPGDLVLFHNWVGTLFALAYTLIGFLFMLYLLLPKDQERATA